MGGLKAKPSCGPRPAGRPGGLKEKQERRRRREEEAGGLRGRKNMLQLERLNGSPLYLNIFQIEYVECIPETKIRMMNGDFFLVKDTVESVCRQMEQVMNRYFHGQ